MLLPTVHVLENGSQCEYDRASMSNSSPRETNCIVLRYVFVTSDIFVDMTTRVVIVRY